MTGLRFFRLEADLTLAELGRLARIDVPRLSRIELRRVVPSVSEAERLSAVTGIDPSQLQEAVKVVEPMGDRS